jgi:flagellar assembly protein FliH
MGSVIKSGNLSAGTTGPGQMFPFDDMGNSYLTKVREEATRIIAQSRAEAEKIKAQAVEAGKKEAMQTLSVTLQAKVDEQMKTLRPALDDVVQKLGQARHAWQRHWEQHALKTALAIAGRIVRGALAQKPEITLNWIREALELAAGSEQITLRLNPADMVVLQGQVQDLTARLGKAARCQVVADAAVSAGGCVVETDFGVIDQQLESQLARLDQELMSR